MQLLTNRATSTRVVERAIMNNYKEEMMMML